MSQSLKDAVLAKVDFVALARGHTQLKRAGREWSGKCPFPGHPDSSPSFGLNEEKGLCHCHGCRRGGNAIDFQCLVDGGDPGSGDDFRAALEKLAGICGLNPADFSRDPQRSRAQSDERARLRAVNEAALSFWQGALKDSARGQAAREYLASRGIEPRTWAEFGLGYAPPVLPGGEGWRRLLDTLLGAGHKIGDLLALGLVKLKDGQTQADASGRNCYDSFRGRIIFPVLDLQGRPIGFCGRALSSADTPKFLNTTTTPLYEKSKTLFNLNRMKPGPDGLALVVEGNWEPLLLAQCGLTSDGVGEAGAPCGTAFTPEHAEALKKRGFRGIASAFDNDPAGQQATERLARAHMRGELGLSHLVVDWAGEAGGTGLKPVDCAAAAGSGGANTFKDPAELLLQPGGPKRFAAALQNPIPAAQWLARRLMP